MLFKRFLSTSVVLAFLFSVNAAESTTQLIDNYSGTASWDATSKTMTFESTGTIYFSWKKGDGTNKRKDLRQNYWSVPTGVKKVYIKAGVTVTGAFYFNGTCTIEGEDRETSVVYGTDKQSWTEGNNEFSMYQDEWLYCQFQNESKGGSLTIKNLTSKNPFSYHIRGWGIPVYVSDCNFIDTRGGHHNHSDGFLGGDGSSVDNCYFETGDDVFKIYYDYTVNNCTIKMIQNTVPIQGGWGSYSNGSKVTFNNLTITGTSGRNSDGNAIIACSYNGSYSVTVNINGCTIKNPNAAWVSMQGSTVMNGTVQNAKIDINRYWSNRRSGTCNMTICGSTAERNNYDCYNANGFYTWQANGNPIITHMHAADPSAKVFSDGKLWVYPSHDQDGATDYSTMDGYHVYSTEDMVTWTDHGEILHSDDVSWDAPGYMWAPDCAEKNGKYYFYFPTKTPGGKWVTGVAVSDKPDGPFTPEPNYIEGTSGIDPMCFIDDDGTAYLYFGHSKVARLKDNMIELDESARTVNYGTTASKFEGAWVYKKDGKYYYSWSNWQGDENGYRSSYSMGDSPYGPFTYKGSLGPQPKGSQDHHSIVEFKGNWYYFYHKNVSGNYNLKTRNFCADYLFFNSDGTMKRVVHTDGGVGNADDGPGGIIPGKTQAEAYTSMNGVQTQSTTDAGGGENVGWIDNGDWMEYVFDVTKAGEYTVEFRVASLAAGAKLNLKKGNTVLASVNGFPSGGWQNWITVSETVTLSEGEQTLRVEATGGGWNFNWMNFKYIGEANNIADLTGNFVNIYPNPATSKVYIERNSETSLNKVELLDMLGNTVVFEKSPKNGNVQLNIEDLQSGMYMLRVTSTQGNVAIKKIMKN